LRLGLPFAYLPLGLQMERNKSASALVAKPALAGFLALLLLAYSALAVSPSLHELLHHDAGSSDHNCFITFFAKGQITPAAIVQGAVLVAALFGGVALLADFSIPASKDYCVSASRAPPASSRF
jgi:hypothetical protein